ncbi:MAG: hypothetical protein KF897_15890, partial [Opitutaceae bacterium]|nr:hypothetical protein [Opitutaceae bacterium]
VLTVLAVLTGPFLYLWVMVSEPAHPGSLIALLVAVAGAVGYRWLAQGRGRTWGVLVGACAGALVLTKINVGGFFVLAALAWIALHHASAGVRRWAPYLVAAGGSLLPVALMHAKLGSGWGQSYALIFAATAIAAAVATARGAAAASGRALGWALAGGIAAGLAILGAVLLRQTSLADIVAGVVLNPLRHPTAFSLGYAWPAGSVAWALLSVLLLVGAVITARLSPRLVVTAIAGLRLVAALGLAFALLSFPTASPDRLVFGFGAPCLWFFLWPLPGAHAAHRPAYAWLAWLWLGQYLHAYPVAGSQVAWGTFLALPIVAIGSHEAVVWLIKQYRSPSALFPRAAFVAGQCLLAALTLALGARFASFGQRYLEGSDLGLPGAEIIRLPSEASALFRILAVNAGAHGDLLFSEPGMFSLNLWSELPTPTLANTTHWFSLLDQTQQQRIVARLEAHPQACVIVQREHIEYLTRRRIAPTGPLHDYLAAHYPVAFRLDDFEFRVRQGRQIHALHLGRIDLVSDTPGQPNTVLHLRLFARREIAVARIELSAPRVPGSGALAFTAANARLAFSRISPDGTPTEPRAAAHWPFHFTGTVDLAVSYDRFTQPHPYAGGLIRLFDAERAEVALARLAER